MISKGVGMLMLNNVITALLLNKLLRLNGHLKKTFAKGKMH